MTQNRFKIILSIMTIVVLAALAVMAYFDHRLRPVAPPMVQVVPKAAPAPDCDTLVTKDAKADEAYWRTGHLGRHETCMKGDTWYLKYTTPAGQRLLELAFTPDADCTVDDVKAQCDKMNPPSGSKTSAMSGLPEGSLLRLGVLKFSTK